MVGEMDIMVLYRKAISEIVGEIGSKVEICSHRNFTVTVRVMVMATSITITNQIRVFIIIVIIAIITRLSTTQFRGFRFKTGRLTGATTFVGHLLFGRR